VFNIDQLDPRPVRGANLFAEPYANIFLCARKKSGKTQATFHILKKCAGRKTKIVVFSSTWDKDPVYEAMRNYFSERDVAIEGFDSMFEDDKRKVCLLDTLLKTPESAVASVGASVGTEQKQQKVLKLDDEDDPVKEPKERKEKYKSPEWIFVFDDLSDELKTPTLMSYLKKNRHYKSKFIISSQYYKDIAPAARKQVDYYLVFKGASDDLLEVVHKDSDLPIDFDVFQGLYSYATKEPYTFLYIDKANSKLRKNFNEELEPEDDDDSG
jgi:hypothetical protein